ncbi:MAG: complex I subunit 5 family protein [Lamprobacter sp.]|uniref:complex I subunit 5 family protein n=1 Tax=Lamprobacter sp. TaxID=3100796 RepID=UPI002B258F02|nr:complex I subunit 5 family protein [Lamprobacter sp.]MEA3640484.1 complex I subunit 5 family protein [Lamprobacter sp.]
MTDLPFAPQSLASLSLGPLLFATLLFTALLWPLLLALRSLLSALIAAEKPRRKPIWLLDWLWISAPWPALVLAVLGPDGSLWLEAWLLGGQWEFDDQRRLLLAFSALLWGLAGWYARGYFAAEQAQAAAGDPHSRARLLRFALFWPLTLCGNLLLLVAEDIASFYLGFALMTFSAYPLVIHSGSREARTGGLAYLVMAVLGEGLILAGLLWGAGTGSALTLSELRATLATADMGLWMGVLLWLGFGVKAGVIGLHLWLPLAHPVAPTPASAVLSGVMIKAGLVGWLSTLPLGMAGVDAAFQGLGVAMLTAGLIGAFAAALLGVAQRHPKAVLAYSSVSQMGMIAALVAIGLLQPDNWPALSVLVLFFAAHHGLSKGALFLGVGISEQPPRLPAWLLWTLLTLPALSLAGALSSGLIAKWGSKKALDAAGEEVLAFWLSLAAVGTTLLMARTLWRQWRQRPQHAPTAAKDRRLLAPMPLAWLISVLAALSLPLWFSWLAGGIEGVLSGRLANRFAWPPLSALPTLLWPLGLGLLLSIALGWGLRRVATRLSHWLPAGDLWWPLAFCGRWLWRLVIRMLRRLALLQSAWIAWWVARERDGLTGLDTLTHAEGWLRRQLALLLLVVALGLAAVLLLSAKSTPLWR